MKLLCVFKKMPGDKIIVAESRRWLRWRSVMSACTRRVREFRAALGKNGAKTRLGLLCILLKSLSAASSTSLVFL